MTNPDLDILAATAYETGIDPIDYAAAYVIQSHIDVYLELGAGILGRLPADTTALSLRILGDLLGAGWTPPEVP